MGEHKSAGKALTGVRGTDQRVRVKPTADRAQAGREATVVRHDPRLGVLVRFDTGREKWLYAAELEVVE